MAIRKQKRYFTLSDEAFKLLQALGEDQGVDTSAFLEVEIRSLAKDRLPPVLRERIKRQSGAAENEMKQDAG